MTYDRDETLHWYREGRFSADDATRATGLTERAQRELLKVGAIRAIPQAKTKMRLLDRDALKRAAIIAPINNCGFSLPVSGRIAYCIPGEEYLRSAIDPRSENENVRAWFRPENTPVSRDSDLTIKIINKRFVYFGAEADQFVPFGELKSDGTVFVSWYPIHEYQINGKDTPKWEYHLSGSEVDPSFLQYEYQEIEDDSPLYAEAMDSVKSGEVVVSINVALALVKALRRLMEIDPPIN